MDRQVSIKEKDAEINRLKSEKNKELEVLRSEKDSEINVLMGEMNKSEPYPNFRTQGS